MFSNSKDIWKHLRSDIVYKTYSDEKLAKLYLKNVDNFPIHIFSKVLEILLDPLFKLEDITFKSVGDIFEHISAYRREDLSPLSLGRQIPSRSTSLQLVSRPPAIPLDVVSLVVDKMVENRAPLGIASMEEGWKDAYFDDVADFHAMSLVHPSWTPIVRGGLRRRAIIPYYQLDSFLVSPLCGPWVTELIIYWTVDNGTKGITPSDIYLFESLLRRVPNVHSLAFNTSLVWLSFGFIWNTGGMPPLRVVSCLELVSKLLPSLENLWLNHRLLRTDDPLSESLGACREMGSLFQLLPRMQSLKRLSLYGWKEDRERAEVHLNEHPGTNFKTLELTEKVALSRRALNWLIKPRNGFNLRSLSISIEQLRRVDYPLSNLQELRLYLPVNHVLDPSNILERYDQLVDLHLFVSYYLLDLGDAVFPKNLENISFYMPGVGLRCLLGHRNAYSSTPRRFSSNFVQLIKEQLSHLKRLRSLRLVGAPSVEDMWKTNQNAAIRFVPEREIPRQLLDRYEERGISLVWGEVSSVSPRY